MDPCQQFHILNDPEFIDPDTHWWTGPVTCSICLHPAVAVIEIARELDEPIVAMECSKCRNFTCHPDETST